MITTRLYLDTRAVNDDEPAPLKFAITKKRQTAYIPIGVKLRRNQWDAKKLRICDIPNRQRVELFVKSKVVEIENLILELQTKGEFVKMSATQIKNRLLSKLDPEEEKRDLFLSRYEAYTNSREATRTKEIYGVTLKKMKDFDKKVATYSFEDISKDWLYGFDTFLKSQGLKKNSRNIHFRNIRAVFNDAIDNEVTTHYPFRKFDIAPEQTAKRSLTIEELRTLFNYRAQPWQKKYLDYFKLSFFLIGINPADILDCTNANVNDGRLVYRRKKTGRLYSIKLESEALELIDEYKGKDKLVNFAENMKNYKQFVGKANKGLKTIGNVIKVANQNKKPHDFQKTSHIAYVPLFPNISLYWARHTWATIAFSIGISEEIIAEALGHTHGNKTTAIYINKSVANIDMANRRVIDFVLNKEGR
jgi:integrase